MKTINLFIIVLFNLIGGLLSYSWCYRLFIRKYSTPEWLYLIFYEMCYFSFILIAFFILNKVNRPVILLISGVLIAILISFISWIVNPFILFVNADQYLEFDLYDLFMPSLMTLNFIIYPVILLCCHYSFLWIEKTVKKT
ncbi:hypothetical protein B6D12_12775 [Gilliamella apicola]|uniref:hypothetical protein n=1 Tax=Gilliamella TaxID=1193503 RepID=UPI00081045DC|nr:hypothetical protein [Gilliamella apicola]OCF92789.1 hypothetical protein A9G17_06500 [Gilliamella apicola]OTP89905.1 hypothetical protein B5S41_05195 [Gilliamella apicola]OTP95965.1 hypothetical protein B6D13_02555 [Gilliamella apicola]OTQ03391.1 hypothetical protein B6D07_01630 [Gilliamella apicola]OTQ03852.1 hypothetical protein B6D12_12775 [Gilliamella apicola]